MAFNRTLVMQRQSRGVDPDLFAPSATASSGYGNGNGYTTKQASMDSYSSNQRQGLSSRDGFYQQQQQEQQAAAVSIELEHVSGYTGKGKGTIHAHPGDPASFITW